jgi:hypothetical protein
MKFIRRFLLVLLASVPVCRAATWYCSPTGNGSGTSISSPFLLQTALTSSSISPGDTVWLLGGTYFPTGTFPFGNVTRQGWQPTISGSAGNQIVFASYPGQWAAIDRMWSLNTDGCGYLCFSNLEFFDSLKGHNLTNTTGPPPGPPWVHFPMGGQTGFTWINCVIHDVHDCFGGGAQGYSVRGCVFWYVGWNVLEHLCYPAPASFTGNVAGWTLQNVINFNVANFLMESNIVFGGGDQEPAIPNAPADIEGIGYNETIDHNYFYNRQNSSTGCVCINGYSGASGTVSIFDNVFVAASPVYNMGTGTTGTLLFATNTLYASYTNKNNGGVSSWQTVPGQTVDYNQYFSVPSAGNGGVPEFTLNGGYGVLFPAWQSTTGFDPNGSAGAQGQEPPSAYYVIPNADVPNRANIVIYNWSLANNVSVSLNGVLNNGDAYYLYSVQNYNQGNVSGPVPIASGTYNGTSISIPMNNLSVAPILYGSNMSSDGVPVVQPNPTSPEFGAFVVMGAASTNIITITNTNTNTVTITNTITPPLPPTSFHVVLDQ